MKHTKKQFALNVASGWLVQLVVAAVGFFLMSYIIKRLGQQEYGIYQLARSSIVFFMFLQLGMGPTLIRFFAKAIATHDLEGIRTIASTSQFILGGLGFLACLLFFLFIPFFIRFYDISPDLSSDTVGLLVCMAVSIFLNMIVIVPQGLVLGLNRYELSNGIQIISNLLRVFLVVALFELIRPSIFFVGLSILASALWQLGALFVISARHLKRAALFSLLHIRKSAVRSLLGFSSLNLLNSMAAALVFQGPVLIIGKILGQEMVAAFAPALIVSGAMQGILGHTAQPLVPIASNDLESTGGASLGKWAISMGQFVAFIGFGFVLLMTVFGPELMHLWLGQNLMWTWSIVAVISTGVAISQVQSANYFLALGGGNIKPTVYSQIAMAIVVFFGTLAGLSWLDWDLFSVALFIGGCIFARNTFYLAYAYSNEFKYSYFVYLWRVYACPALVVIICIATGWGMKWVWPIDHFWKLTLQAGIILSGYGILSWFFLIPSQIKHRLIVALFMATPLKI